MWKQWMTTTEKDVSKVSFENNYLALCFFCGIRAFFLPNQKCKPNRVATCLHISYRTCIATAVHFSPILISYYWKLPFWQVISQITWHEKGDYFASVTPEGKTSLFCNLVQCPSMKTIVNLSSITSKVPFSEWWENILYSQGFGQPSQVIA